MTAIEDATHIRIALIAQSYTPVPLFGKAPAMNGWQKVERVTPKMITMWGHTWPGAVNTGCLTRHMPTLDLDILHLPAVVAIEDFLREHYEERGWLLTRIGKMPKRAIPFVTDTPFKKITVPLISPDGRNDEKIEFLADGQQLVVHGLHPETNEPYRWLGGTLWDIRSTELPYLHPYQAIELVEDAVRILADFGYARADASPPRASANGNGGAESLHHGGAKFAGDRWRKLLDNILAGRSLHDSFRDLAAMLAASGMNSGAAKHLLDAISERVEPYDARVESRLRDIPRAIDTAFTKYSKR